MYIPDNLEETLEVENVISQLDLRVFVFQILKAIEKFGLAEDYTDENTRRFVDNTWVSLIHNPLRILKNKPKCHYVFISDDSRRKSDNNYWRNDYTLSANMPEYKGCRDTTKRGQIYFDCVSSCYKVAKHFGIHIVKKEGFESDDFAGSTVRFKISQPSLKNHYLFLHTSDGDWTQLINDEHNILWYNALHWFPRIRNENNFLHWAVDKKKYKIDGEPISNPRDIVTYKELYGDSGDNLPKGSSRDVIDLLNPPLQVELPEIIQQEIIQGKSNVDLRYSLASERFLLKNNTYSHLI